MVNFMKRSHAYQLIRNIEMLTHAIKLSKKTKGHIIENSVSTMAQELEQIQQKLMSNPMDNYLLMKEKSLWIRIWHCPLEQKIYKAER